MSSTGKQHVCSVKSSGSPPAAVPKKVDVETPAPVTKDVDVKEKPKIPKPSPTSVKENVVEEKVAQTSNVNLESPGKTPPESSERLPANVASMDSSPVVKAPEVPVQRQAQAPVPVAVPRPRVPPPVLPRDVRPFILATHLVPSLPIALFELLAEGIEAATELPVSVLYEPHSDRPVAKDVTDFACLPAYSEWEDGDLLPVTFVFAHPLNTDGSGGIYVDVVVAEDRIAQVKSLMDLRGHRCALPDRGNRRGTASLLLKHLRAKGESPAFFGDIKNIRTQAGALVMVGSRAVEIGVVESPVRICYKGRFQGDGKVVAMDSLGPLPPYAIYVKKFVPAEVREKVTSYLLNIKNIGDWAERFSEFGITGFTRNSMDAYKVDDDEKELPTSVRYY